jgi:N-methylhydantoinase A
VRYEAAADMRFVGQEHALTIDLPITDEGPLAASSKEICELFRRKYRRLFAAELDRDIEAVTFRATVREYLPELQMAPPAPGSASRQPPSQRRDNTRSAYSFDREGWLDFAIVDRSSLRAGDVIRGPALLLEPTATTCVDAGFEALVHARGPLVITRVVEADEHPVVAVEMLRA